MPINDFIRELSEEYDISENIIKKWYKFLALNYPCFEENSGLNCLENLCQRRSSIKNKTYLGPAESLQISMDAAVYDTYLDKSEPYLSNKYKNLMSFEFETKEDELYYDNNGDDIMEQDDSDIISNEYVYKKF